MKPEDFLGKVYVNKMNPAQTFTPIEYATTPAGKIMFRGELATCCTTKLEVMSSLVLLRDWVEKR